METLDHIHIFKTDIDQIEHGGKLHQSLDNHASIWQWSHDAEDIDRVLRVVSPSMNPAQITELIQQHGHRCEELQ